MRVRLSCAMETVDSGFCHKPTIAKLEGRGQGQSNKSYFPIKI